MSQNAGLKVWILSLGGGAKKTEANTIRLKFKPLRSIAYRATERGAGPRLGRKQVG
jgi:hypothetical protein